MRSEIEDPQLATIFYAGLPADQALRNGWVVLVPMLAHSEVLGTFLIDYSNLTSSHVNQQGLEEIFDERLAILQGIAHQTATAVENIRLLKAQIEEAYVSIALLQVAQAVVSSNDLDESLGSIVRITPILVGVKRSAIFLWDEARNLFRLAQSYGLPRGAGEFLFTPQPHLP